MAAPNDYHGIPVSPNSSEEMLAKHCKQILKLATNFLAESLNRTIFSPLLVLRLLEGALSGTTIHRRARHSI